MLYWNDIITIIFVKVDDFYKVFGYELKTCLIESKKSIKRNREPRLTKSKIMSIIIFFKIVKFKTFKDYSTSLLFYLF